MSGSGNKAGRLISDKGPDDLAHPGKSLCAYINQAIKFAAAEPAQRGP